MVECSTEGMVQEVLYDTFGNVVKDGNPYLRSPLGFAGGLHDWDTGLVRFGWRDYDPDTGRFTAKDPIGAAGGDSDWYGYCLDEPINGRDPEGLTEVKAGVDDSDVNATIRDHYSDFDAAANECEAPEPVITSTTGDTHRPDSRHYQGQAVDLRGRSMDDETMRCVSDAIQARLGDDYDVVPEYFPNSPNRDHIHIEYDPD